MVKINYSVITTCLSIKLFIMKPVIKRIYEYTSTAYECKLTLQHGVQRQSYAVYCLSQWNTRSTIVM